MSQRTFSDLEMAQLETIFNQNGINLDEIQNGTFELPDPEHLDNPSSGKS